MRRLVALTIVGGLLAARGADAQCIVDPDARFTKIDAVPVNLIFPTPSPTELDAGLTAERTYELDIHPIAQNRLRPWRVCFAADAPFFPTPTGSLKPASDLEWSLDRTQWAQVSQVATPLGPTFVGRQLVTVYVRARLRYEDLPATYGPLPLRFFAVH